MNKFAIDTNILIYTHDKSAPDKQNIARDLIVRSPIICTQVVSEYISVLSRVTKIPKEFIIKACMPNLSLCYIEKVDTTTP